MLLGKHFVLLLHLSHLGAEFLNVLFFGSNLLLDHWVDLLHVLRVCSHAAAGSNDATLLRLLDLIKHDVALPVLLHDLIETLGATKIVELLLEVLNAIFEATFLTDVSNQVLVDFHH